MGKPTNAKEDGRITLTGPQVDTIRRRFWLGEWKQVELADEYGVTQGLINHLVHGKIWVHRPFKPDVAAAKAEYDAMKAERRVAA